jgi:hypothetical protein
MRHRSTNRCGANFDLATAASTCLCLAVIVTVTELVRMGSPPWEIATP